MIIDFSAKNFRSFKEEQRLSFVASNYDNDLPQNVIEPNLPGMDGVRLLKGVAIYGANAAGKTNVLQALNFIDGFVEHSANELNQGDHTGVEPFALDPKTPKQPSEFLLRFVVDGVRYHFALALDRQRIHFESLSAYPKGREQIWYQRTWDDKKKSYEWGPERPTDFRRDPKLVEYTRDNALFLSTAAKWNNKALEPIYLWFRKRLQFLRLSREFPPLPPSFTARAIMEGANQRNQICSLLRHADFGVLSAKASEREIRRDELPKDLPESIASRILKQKDFDISFGHRGTGGKEYPLSFDRQSAGTQKFFSLAGPWLDILQHGFIAALDEIESSMHPQMVVELLRLVFSNEHNPSNAQILFTTHNPLILDPTLIRRDQIWFVDKDDEGASHLYPLSDYKPRKGESLVRGYLAGRYGAVPFIPEGLLGHHPVHA